ncbi:MAG: hypothetical protein R3190_14720, partial [Thermoanaerobaculia bacterium]|nr:hypothetical protein [Thermoanaerobaculia bacterium]
MARLETVRKSAGAAAARATKAGALAAKRSGEARGAAERVDQLAKGVDEATKVAAQASEALSVATKTLHDAQHADMSAELRSGLEPGRPCPVCAQQVDVVPESEDAPQL